MSDVSVIGAGAMGSALVEALANSSADVTVWNRTRAKAEALSGARVRVAGSATEALLASPLAIVALSDHEMARTVVEQAAQALDGRVVASTSFVTPEQAREFATVVGTAGGTYLDLEIAAWPRQVRSGHGVFLISGERTAYEAHQERIERIGRATYVNDSPGSAYTSGMAVQLAYFPMAVGLLQGWRIAESMDFSPERFTKAIMDMYPFHIEQLLAEIIAPPDPTAREVEASIDVLAAGAAEYGEALREMGLDAGLYDALHQLFTAASEAGHGQADWTSVADHVATRRP